MRKSTPEPLLPVTYIRVRELFHAFLSYKYGDGPIDLPVSGSELYNILASGLVPNYRMARVCYSSFSGAAYDAAFGHGDLFLFPEGSCTEPLLPKPEDQKKLIAFVMPRSVIIGGRRVDTDKWFQLTSSAYKEFNRSLESEFWAAYIKHDQRYNLYCLREGRKYNQELSMEKFMQLVGMDFALEDNFARYWRKKKQTDPKLFDYYSNKDSTAMLKRQMGDNETD